MPYHRKRYYPEREDRVGYEQKKDLLTKETERYTEEQIIRILREVEAGELITPDATSATFRERQFTVGETSAARWANHNCAD